MAAPTDDVLPPDDLAGMLPPPDGTAPLHELGRDELSVFFFLAFTDAELTQLLDGLGVSVPGYRMEKLSGVQKADTLADEVRARPEAAKLALTKLRAVYEFPALDVVSLSPPVAEELGLLAVEDDAPVRILWRLLADPHPEVRALATAPLKALATLYYGGSGAAPGQPRPKKEKQAPDEAEAALKKAQKEARESGRAQERAEARAEGLEAQLKDVRAEVTRATAELAQVKRDKAKADEALAKAKEQLARAKADAGGADAGKAKRELEKATAAVAALEGQKARLAEENAQLKDELASASRGAGAPPQVLEPAAEDAPVEEAPATWLKPRFSKEFYDSLEGWDARLQRAAFKQAFLLSENHRHPSLRAIPLEGLPGYFRVRVATDVRLIYRRTDAGEVELLSLIDREDLDRYVRQARTR